MALLLLSNLFIKKITETIKNLIWNPESDSLTYKICWEGRRRREIVLSWACRGWWCSWCRTEAFSAWWSGTLCQRTSGRLLECSQWPVFELNPIRRSVEKLRIILISCWIMVSFWFLALWCPFILILSMTYTLFYRPIG